MALRRNMTIRERLLDANYTEEEINKMAEEEYNQRVSNLPKKKKFCETSLGKFLLTDWPLYLYNQYVLYLYQKEMEKQSQAQECEIDRTNPYEIYKYNASHGIKPIKTTNHGNGNYTHEYRDGTIVNVQVNLSGGVISAEDLENIKIHKRELLADYLNIDAEEILQMTEDQIDELVKQNEKRKSKTKRRVRQKN